MSFLFIYESRMSVSLRSAVSWIGNHKVLGLVALLLVGLSLDFLLRFCVKALRLNHTLGQIIHLLHSGRLIAAPQHCTDLSVMIGYAARIGTFHRPWQEFCKTLHLQRKTDYIGGSTITEWRATCFAEQFFSNRALVDTPLRTGYFSRLPSILTGLGIIGTFSGLIEGLKDFFPSSDPTFMPGALNNLIVVVANGFVTSVAAIALATVLTMLEITILTSCYCKVDEIQQAVDTMFRSGVGEEYLGILASAPAAYATQAHLLNKELFLDFKHFLNEEAKTWVETMVRGQAESHAKSADSVVERLRASIEDVSNAVRSDRTSQGYQIETIAAKISENLTQAIDTTLGTRLNELSSLRVAGGKVDRDAALPLDNSKHSAVIMSQMVSSIEGAAATLSKAGIEAEAYLGKVNDVFGTAYASFADHLDKTLSHANARFHGEIANTFDLLAGGIEALEDILSAIPSRDE